MHDAADFRWVKRYQKFLFLLLSLVYILPFIQGVIMSVVAKDVMRDLQLTPDRMGVLGSAYMWVYAVSMLFSGMAAAYFGPRRYVTWFYLMAGLGMLIFGWADSLALACLGRMLTGVGTACILSSCLTLFGRWYRGESYASATAVFFSIGGTGSFLGAAPLALANVAWGWRASMQIVGWMTIAFAALVMLFVRDWPPAGCEKALGLSQAPRQPATLSGMWDSLKILSRSGDFWKLVLWFFSMSGAYLSFAGLWGIPYFKDVHRLTDSRAGLAVSLFAIGFIVGSPLLSWLSEKKLRSNRIGIAGGSILGAAAYAVMIAAGDRLGYGGLIVICLVLGVAHNAPNALVYSSARNLFGSRLSGMATGVMAGMCFVSGGILQIVGGGVLTLAQNHGLADDVAYHLAFIPNILLCLVAAYCGATLSKGSDPGRISPQSWRMVLKKEE